MSAVATGAVSAATGDRRLITSDRRVAARLIRLRSPAAPNAVTTHRGTGASVRRRPAAVLSEPLLTLLVQLVLIPPLTCTGSPGYCWAASLLRSWYARVPQEGRGEGRCSMLIRCPSLCSHISDVDTLYL